MPINLWAPTFLKENYMEKTKKFAKGLLPVMAFGLLAAVLSGCGNNNESKPQDNSGNQPDISETSTPSEDSQTSKVEVKVTLDKTSATLKAGETLQLNATVEGTEEKVTWSSSKNDVASVDANGLVSANAEGDAVITAMADGIEATCNIKVEGALVLITFECEGQKMEFLPNGTIPMTIMGTSATFTWHFENNQLTIDPYAGGIVTFKVYKSGQYMCIDMINSFSGTSTWKALAKDFYAAFNYKAEKTGEFAGLTEGDKLEIYNTGAYKMTLGDKTSEGDVEFVRGVSLKLIESETVSYEFVKGQYDSNFTYSVGEEAKFKVSNILMAYYLGETIYNAADEQGNAVYFFDDNTVVVTFSLMGNAMECPGTFEYNLLGTDPVLTITMGQGQGTAECVYDKAEDEYTFSYVYTHPYAATLKAEFTLKLDGTEVDEALFDYQAAPTFVDYEVTITSAKNGEADVDVSKVSLTFSGEKAVLSFNGNKIEEISKMTVSDGVIIYMSMSAQYLAGPNSQGNPTQAGFISLGVGDTQRTGSIYVFGIEGLTLVQYEVSDTVWASLAADCGIN